MLLRSDNPSANLSITHMTHPRLKPTAFRPLLRLTLGLLLAVGFIQTSESVAYAKPSKSKKKPAQATTQAPEESTESGDDDSIQVQIVAPKRKGNKQNVNEEDGFNSERSYRYGNEELEVDPD